MRLQAGAQERLGFLLAVPTRDGCAAVVPVGSANFGTIGQMQQLFREGLAAPVPTPANMALARVALGLQGRQPAALGFLLPRPAIQPLDEAPPARRRIRKPKGFQPGGARQPWQTPPRRHGKALAHAASRVTDMDIYNSPARSP